MNYDEQILAATEAQEMDGTAWLHLNPNYMSPETPVVALPVARGSARSRHWSEITPGWLVQEALNRGGGGNWGIERLLEMQPVDGGWHIVARIGMGKPARYFVTVEEAEAGEGGTALDEEVAA